MSEPLKYISNIGNSIYNDAAYYATVKVNMGIYNDKYKKMPIFKNDTKALVIKLHGMNAEPGQFMLHMNQFEKYNIEHNNTIQIYVPEILNKGMATVASCGDAIFAEIDTFLKNMYRTIPIFLIGISNGGRIGLYLYSKIQQTYNHDRIYLTTLGAPLKGTHMIDVMTMTRAHWFTNYAQHNDVIDEMRFDSPKSKELIANCEAHTSFKNNTRLYASTNDIFINPYTCGILDGHNNVVVSDVGHNGLVYKYYSDQIDWCIKIIEKLNV